MKIFICEDDVRQRENIVSIINNYIMIEEKPMEIEVATSDPYEVLERAKELKDIGCYFLDIQLEADIKELEAKRQQEILKEYGMSLSDLEAFLANNKDKLGGDA